MSKVALVIACGSRKVWTKQHDLGPIAARLAYTGGLFCAFRRYAEKYYPEDWFVFSAKYGLISPYTKIENYNVTFTSNSSNQISKYKLRSQCDSLLRAYPNVISLAGAIYNKRLTEALPSGFQLETPLASLNLFQRMKWVSREMAG